MDSYQIEHIPTLLIIQVDGSEVDRIVDLPGDKDRYRQLLTLVYQGEGTYRQLLGAHDDDPRDVQTAYRLFTKHVYRGDLEGVVSVGRRILDLRNGLTPEPMNPVDDDLIHTVHYTIRTTLYRAGREAVLQYFDLFPEVTFAKSVYRYLARHYAAGHDSDKADAFFERASRDCPNDEKLKTYHSAYLSKTGRKQP